MRDRATLPNIRRGRTMTHEESRSVVLRKLRSLIERLEAGDEVQSFAYSEDDHELSVTLRPSSGR